MPMGTQCAPLIHYWVTRSAMNVWLAKYEQLITLNKNLTKHVSQNANKFVTTQ